MSQRKISQHNNFSVKSNNTVFFGDDITAEALWSDLFPNTSVRNRGITGDTTSNAIKRLASLAKSRPRKIFINIGANDLGHSHKLEALIADYTEMLNLLQAISPATRIVLISVLPLSSSNIQECIALNSALAQLAKKRGLTFVDLFSEFFTADNSLKNGYTDKRLRLMGQGYTAWRDLIQPFVI